MRGTHGWWALTSTGGSQESHVFPLLSCILTCRLRASPTCPESLLSELIYPHCPHLLSYPGARSPDRGGLALGFSSQLCYKLAVWARPSYQILPGLNVLHLLNEEAGLDSWGAFWICVCIWIASSSLYAFLLVVLQSTKPFQSPMLPKATLVFSPKVFCLVSLTSQQTLCKQRFYLLMLLYLLVTYSRLRPGKVFNEFLLIDWWKGS